MITREVYQMSKYSKPEILIEMFNNEYVVVASSIGYVEGLENVDNRMMVNYEQMKENIKFVD